MSLPRIDARRALAARRERATVGPVPTSTPLVSTVVVAALTAALLVLLGIPIVIVLGVVAAIAIGAAAAARRTTASLLAGLGLMLIRPFPPGERVRVWSSESQSTFEAEVLRVGLLSTALCTESGVVLIGNAQMLRAAPDQRA